MSIKCPQSKVKEQKFKLRYYSVKFLKAKFYKLFYLLKGMKNEEVVLNMDEEFNLEKFKQVLHYIIAKVGSLDNVGKTVLYKILYFYIKILEV